LEKAFQEKTELINAMKKPKELKTEENNRSRELELQLRKMVIA
jgi:hypothetical protein